MANATQERTEMTCPLNGECCLNGVRSDFKATDKVGNKLTCRWWTQIRGKLPQAEEVTDIGDCSIPWIPVTQLEGSQMTRHVNASIDEMRKDVRKQAHFTRRVAGAVMRLGRAMAQRLMPPPINGHTHDVPGVHNNGNGKVLS